MNIFNNPSQKSNRNEHYDELFTEITENKMSTLHESQQNQAKLNFSESKADKMDYPEDTS